ncbi:hypothetical protein SNEBB_011474 [Seison nebaliae]|nr:hypothetical protein SNEBB_011474 [Seison nebaliae]
MKLLLEKLQTVLLNDILSQFNENAMEKNSYISKIFRVLVVDDLGLNLINRSLKFSSLINMGITLIEFIKKQRQPLPAFDVIYLVECTSENISKIIEDQKKGLYKSSYIYFLTTCSSEMYEKCMSYSPNPTSLISIWQVNLAFHPYTHLSYTLSLTDEDDGNEFLKLSLLSNENMQMKMEEKIVRRLMTLFFSYNEIPNIRYQKNSNVCTKLAKKIEVQLKEEIDKVKVTSCSSCLLIVDRSIDPLSPLIHEASFESLLYEVFYQSIDHNSHELSLSKQNGFNDVKTFSLLDEIYTSQITQSSQQQQPSIQQSSEKEKTLQNFSPYRRLWDSIRYDSLNVAQMKLSNKLKELTNDERKLMTFEENVQDQQAQINNRLKRLAPHKIKEKNDVQLTLTLLERVMKHYSRLEKLIEVEQTVVANCQPVLDFLQIIKDSNIDQMDRLRLILLIYLTQRGYSKKSFNEKKLSINEIEQMMSHVNMSESHVQLFHFYQKLIEKRCDKSLKPNHQLSIDNVLMCDQWRPMIQSFIRDLITGNLSCEKFPLIKLLDTNYAGTQSKSSNKLTTRLNPFANTSRFHSGGEGDITASARRGPKEGKDQSPSPSRHNSKDFNIINNQVYGNVIPLTGASKYFIYIVGGMTHSEIRSVHQLRTDKSIDSELFIGSDTIITSPTYLSSILTYLNGHITNSVPI